MFYQISVIYFTVFYYTNNYFISPYFITIITKKKICKNIKDLR